MSRSVKSRGMDGGVDDRRREPFYTHARRVAKTRQQAHVTLLIVIQQAPHVLSRARLVVSSARPYKYPPRDSPCPPSILAHHHPRRPHTQPLSPPTQPNHQQWPPNPLPLPARPPLPPPQRHQPSLRLRQRLRRRPRRLQVAQLARMVRRRNAGKSARRLTPLTSTRVCRSSTHAYKPSSPDIDLQCSSKCTLTLVSLTRRWPSSTPSSTISSSALRPKLRVRRFLRPA